MGNRKIPTTIFINRRRLFYLQILICRQRTIKGSDNFVPPIKCCCLKMSVDKSGSWSVIRYRWSDSASQDYFFWYNFSGFKKNGDKVAESHTKTCTLTEILAEATRYWYSLKAGPTIVKAGPTTGNGTFIEYLFYRDGVYDPRHLTSAPSDGDEDEHLDLVHGKWFN